MHHDVISAAVLGMVRQLLDRVEVLIRDGHDDAGLAVALFHRNFEVALALVEAHRKELALLAGDEQALDVEVIDPVANI